MIQTSNEILQEIRENWWQLATMGSQMALSDKKDVNHFHYAAYAYRKLRRLTSECKTLRQALTIIDNKDLTMYEAIREQAVKHVYKAQSTRYTLIENLPKEVRKVWYEVQNGEYSIEAIESSGKHYCVDCFDFLLCDGSKELHYAVAEAYSRPVIDGKQDVTIAHPLVDGVVVLGLFEYEIEGAKENGIHCCSCNAELVEPYQEDEEIDYPGYETLPAPDYSHYND